MSREAARAVPPAPASTIEPSRGRPWTGATAAGTDGPPGRVGQLCWFPDPIGAEDCYRLLVLPYVLLLVRAMPGVERGPPLGWRPRRRDRSSAHLPMLRKPHPEGLAGAVRVEVRGRQAARSEARRARCVGLPGGGRRGDGGAGGGARAGPGRLSAGSAGLAALDDSRAFLAELATVGIKPAVFDGLS